MKKKWKPKSGERIWYVAFDYPWNLFDVRSLHWICESVHPHGMFNIFRTKKEAKSAVKKIEKILKFK